MIQGVYAYFHGYPCKWSEYPRCTRKFVIYAYVHVEFCSITHLKCIFQLLSLYADSMENEVPILHINGYPWISAYNMLISMEIREKGCGSVTDFWELTSENRQPAALCVRPSLIIYLFAVLLPG